VAGGERFIGRECMCCRIVYGGGMILRKSNLAWLVIVLIIVLYVLGGKYLEQRDDSRGIPEGTYGISGIEYLTGLSSSSPDYFLEKNRGITFTFNNDEFYVWSEGAAEPSIQSESFSDVTYAGIPLGATINLLDGENVGLNLSKYKEKKAFKVLSINHDTGYTIYRLDDEIWLSYRNPNSNFIYVDYLLSLQVDELQNQSAAEILNILLAADFPIKEPIVIKEDNDPSGLLGTEHGYISKAEWIDTRGAKSLRSTVTLEIFRTKEDCEERKTTLENLYAYISSDGYNYYSEGSVLIAVQKGITDIQAAIYGEALKSIRKGEMPKH
jgi:hypothetical protein